jgi:hypothetical protein
LTKNKNRLIERLPNQYRKADGLTDRQTDGQTDRQTDKRHRHRDRKGQTWINISVKASRMDGIMDGQTT